MRKVKVQGQGSGSRAATAARSVAAAAAFGACRPGCVCGEVAATAESEVAR